MILTFTYRKRYHEMSFKILLFHLQKLIHVIQYVLFCRESNALQCTISYGFSFILLSKIEKANFWLYNCFEFVI